MGTVPVISTWADGSVITNTLLNSQIHDPIQWLANSRPHCFARQAVTTTSCPNAVYTTLSWDTWDVDTDAGMSNTHPTYYKVNTAGWYLISAAVDFAVNTTGSRQLHIIVNGFAIQGFACNKATQVDSGVMLSRLALLAVNDQVGIQAWQSSGVTLSTDLNYANFRNETSFMDISWQGKDYRVT
jgi:hypothetical protein